jgi:hypothetical protein
MPSRRTYIAGIATVLASAAGCTNRGNPSGTDTPTDVDVTDPKKSPFGTPTEPPEEAKRPVGDDTVAVTDIVARKAVTYQSTMGSGGVLATDDRQYVVASVQTDAALSLEAFSLRAAGDSWPAGLPDTRGAMNYAVAGHEGGEVGSPVGGGGPKFVAVDLPSPLDADEPVIRVKHDDDTAEWTLTDAAVETLAAPAPSFELESFSAPDTVSQGEEMTVELIATNTTNTAGRFLAAVYWPTARIEDDDESHIIDASVDAGATTTQSVTIDTANTAFEDGPVTLELAGHVAAEAEVQVAAGTPA